MTLIADLQSELGLDVVSTDENLRKARSLDWQTPPELSVTPVAVIRPRSTEECARAVRICARHGVPITVQGGLTGLAGGAVPTQGAVALSLDHMNRIEAQDTVGATITVQCGVTLQKVQEACDDQGMFFPLDLGARGSCQIGGNIGTNAGGNRVLRYGMMRDLVLGLEVVLADGTIVSSMNRMLKNNTGYDLSSLFVGSEGTLGIVTRAVLRIFDRPQSQHTTLCIVPDYDSATAMLKLARKTLGASLTAFEVMWPEFFQFACKLHNKTPFQEQGFAVLIEASGAEREGEALMEMLEAGFELGLVSDGAIAQSLKDAEEFWALRDSSGELRTQFWPNANFDISAPTERLGHFVEVLKERTLANWNDAEVIVFGHIADGNIHIAVRTRQEPFPITEIDAMVYGLVDEFDGSISAEHGVGLVKKNYLGHSRNENELATMKRIKQALDPQGLLNPDKVLVSAEPKRGL